MSPNKKNTSSNFDKEKLRKYGGKFAHYFDIFYLVVKGLIGILFILILVLGSLVGGTVIGYFASLVEEVPLPTHAEMETQIYDYNKKSTLYYADNSQISDLRSDLLRTPVSIEAISPFITNAVIATEDENFFIHEGIVPKALIRAGLQEISGASMVSGGSTLTQQLIKQQILSAEVTHSRKATEILYATHLENSFNKEEVLEAYLNVSPFGRNNLGQNIAGIEEAAQGIFGVPASEVNLPQAAFLAGLPQSPISFNPYTQYGTIKEDLSAGIYRQREVLYSMYREGYIDSETHSAAYDYDITTDFLTQEYEDKRNPHQSYLYDLVEKQAGEIFTVKLMQEDGLSEARISELLDEERVVTEEMLVDEPELANEINQNIELRNEYAAAAETEMTTGGYDIYSTIDSAIHRAVVQQISALQDSFGQTQTLTDANGNEVAYPVQVGGTMIENETGRVISFIGGRDYDVSQYNNAFDGRRLSGSVMKPLIGYGPALAENYITPATIIPDIEHTVGLENHVPQNIGETTNQWRDVRHWLTVSQNLPASRLYVSMLEDGVDPAQYIRALGIGPDVISDADFHNPSAVLGGFSKGPTATEISGAYAALGNGGVFNHPYVIEKIVNSNGDVIYQHEMKPVRVWSEATNYLLYDMLRDVTGSIGTARILPNFLNFSNIDLASKTGTSDGDADVWYSGVTPKLSLTTWMGYAGTNELSLQFSDGLRPSHRNIRNWANIMNVVHDVKPEVIGVNETLPQPDSVTSESVLVETGMKAGTVEMPGGEEIQIKGDTKSELFSNENIPGTTTFDFAVGAEDDELRDFWKEQTGSTLDEDDKEESEEDSDEDE